MHPVEKGQLWVMRIHGLVASAALLVPALIAEMQVGSRFGLPPGLFILPVLMVAIYWFFRAAPRRYRALGYRMDEDELHVARGVWLRVDTIVPLGRVQHIDVSQGPLERTFHVGRLVLHTAGTANSIVVLPGLRREDAEKIRDIVRSFIRAAAQ